MINILITGCSRGIGFETVKRFSQIADVNIFAISRDVKGLERLKKECNQINNKSTIHSLSIDLSDLDSINNITSYLKSNLNGTINGVIHNAGYLVKKDFSKLSVKDLNDSFKINCLAPFILTQKLIPFLSKNAHVISISSMGGVQNSQKFPGLSAYSTSKGTLITLTQCLAEEFKTSGLKFNCLALGAVQTEMLNEAFPGYKAPVSASEMAGFIVDFYVQGSKYFNGQVIPVSIGTP
tara:strand:+ start:2072 stop:2782 length:711 start_codon:yes stop_codon:yes gene_type:complete